MSWAVWITGLPGSGKSAIAQAAAAELQARGEQVMVLELDRIRKVITPQPTYSDAEREAVYRALVYMAAALVDAGVAVILDATAHRRAWRELARTTIPNFAEVQLRCPWRSAASASAHASRERRPRASMTRRPARGPPFPG